MGLFNNRGHTNKEDKASQDAAATAEIERLTSLPVIDLAEAMMPAFSPDGPRVPGGGLGVVQILSWLMSSYPRGNKNLTRLMPAAREGVQALEHAGLIQVQRSSDGSVGRLTPTRLGATALEEGTVHQYLTS